MFIFMLHVYVPYVYMYDMYCNIEEEKHMSPEFTCQIEDE
jgi:hypothetical protein